MENSQNVQPEKSNENPGEAVQESDIQLLRDLFKFLSGYDPAQASEDTYYISSEGLAWLVAATQDYRRHKDDPSIPPGPTPELSTKKLAMMLKKFGVSSVRAYLNGVRQRCYSRESFIEAWQKYTPDLLKAKSLSSVK